MMDVGLPGPIDVRGGLLRRSLLTENTPVPTKNAVLARVGTLVGIFCTWLFLLYQIGHNLPAYEEEIHLPTSFDDLKSQSVVLQAYSSAHFYPVLTLFTLVFVFKQTFSIPGSALMNILGGLLYGFWAFPWVSLLTAIGSTLCYRMSQIVIGEFIVARFARSNLGYLRRRVEINRESGNLFYYLLFLRLFPFSPNWFLNVASPFVGVPVAPFFLSIFFGLMPYNYVCVQAAATLAQLDSFADILSVDVLLKLLSISTIALIPALYGQKIASWFRGRASDQQPAKGNQQA
ncbi:Transmembrane protein 41A [Geranomyces michiganensis]|nr:Transmembrane protein 41A [Geranomyces michiganensis]